MKRSESRTIPFGKASHIAEPADLENFTNDGYVRQVTRKQTIPKMTVLPVHVEGLPADAIA